MGPRPLLQKIASRKSRQLGEALNVG